MQDIIISIVGTGIIAIITGMFIQNYINNNKMKSDQNNKQDGALSALEKIIGKISIQIALIKKDTEVSVEQQKEIISISKAIENIKTESKYSKEKIDDVSKRVTELERSFFEFKADFGKQGI